MVLEAELTRSFSAHPREVIALMHDAEGTFVKSFHAAMSRAHAGEEDRLAPAHEDGGQGVSVTAWRPLGPGEAKEGCDGFRGFERVVRFSTPVEAPTLVKRAIGVDSIPVADTVQLFVRDEELAGSAAAAGQENDDESEQGGVFARSSSAPVLGFAGGDMFEATCETVFRKRRRRRRRADMRHEPEMGLLHQEDAVTLGSPGSESDRAVDGPDVSELDDEDVGGEFATDVCFSFTFNAKLWGVQSLAEASMRDSTLAVAGKMADFVECALRDQRLGKLKIHTRDLRGITGVPAEDAHAGQLVSLGIPARVPPSDDAGHRNAGVAADTHEDVDEHFFDAIEYVNETSMQAVSFELARIQEALFDISERVHCCHECIEAVHVTGTPLAQSAQVAAISRSLALFSRSRVEEAPPLPRQRAAPSADGCQTQPPVLPSLMTIYATAAAAGAIAAVCTTLASSYLRRS